MTRQATKLVIITEQLLLRDIARIVESSGATGYTVTPANGKGSRNLRSSGQPTASGAFANVKVEVITASEALARRIADEIAGKYFDNFSGIAYLDQVDVLHAKHL
ncbi:P-II family nitrogen regulator [Thiorhodococcus minor]|uniref:Uncharacterized protein n=1 Tax=Thiorhodococcus minor TaxID=57489 RepID=A0A6M0K611_9GAMM|nr:hypothetical protein [Thiorhodococcus minor]NEV64383.1 hypothetical protein [Thiorhodococcus minor]